MRLIISSIWVLLLCFQSYQINAQDFITEWTFSSAATQISFRALTSGNVIYTWSASPSGFLFFGSLNRSTPNIVTISMEPQNLRRFFFEEGFGSNANNLTNVTQWGAVPWNSMRSAFEGCGYLTISSLNDPILSNVTDMSRMFFNSFNFNSNISGWDVSSVTDMTSMFSFCGDFNQDIGNWNVASVQNMSYMFRSAMNFNQNLGNWNTSSAINMSYMFRSSENFNQDIGNWNTQNVTNMSYMFNNASQFNQDIGNWNTQNVTNMSNMFDNALLFNSDIGNWNTSNVTNMASMFAYAYVFNKDIGGWNTTNVTQMNNMFLEAYNFNQNLSLWDVSNVTNMRGMFWDANSFNQSIENWDVSDVTNFSLMFYSTDVFNKNIGNWVINPNSNLGFMFDNSGMDCNHYTATLVGWQNNNPTVTGRSLGAQGRQYGTSAVAARNALVNNQGWTITGDSPSSATCDALLPIKLISFIATSKENEVDLHWQTSSEINNNYFDIEYSTDGSDFITIGREDGAGNSNTLLDYNFVHKDMSAGRHYYRLKQVDYDGAYSYSDIKSAVVKGEGNGVSVYPNPTKDFVYLSGINEGEYSIRDITNKIVSFGQISTDGISLIHLNAGVYYISIISSTNHQVYRVLKM